MINKKAAITATIMLVSAVLAAILAVVLMAGFMAICFAYPMIGISLYVLIVLGLIWIMLYSINAEFIKNTND
jgi:hypothetical protein